MKGIYILFIIMALHGPISNAQFTLDGEFRPRTELRHVGHQTQIFEHFPVT